MSIDLCYTIDGQRYRTVGSRISRRFPSPLREMSWRSPKSLRCCGQKFSVRHALECKKGGNVISRHNEIRDELADLAAKAIIPSAVRNEPFMHASCPAVKMPELDPQDQPAVSRNLHKSRGEIRGDVSIRGFWNRGTDCIIDVRVTDTDAKSNLSKDPDKVRSKLWRNEKRSCSRRQKRNPRRPLGYRLLQPTPNT
jgi:hypothetical protein